jgi:hypothetical protein
MDEVAGHQFTHVAVVFDQQDAGFHRNGSGLNGWMAPIAGRRVGRHTYAAAFSALGNNWGWRFLTVRSAFLG